MWDGKCVPVSRVTELSNCSCFKPLTLYDSLYVHPCLYKWPSFVPFCVWEIFLCIFGPHLICSFNPSFSGMCCFSDHAKALLFWESLKSRARWVLPPLWFWILFGTYVLLSEIASSALGFGCNFSLTHKLLIGFTTEDQNLDPVSVLARKACSSDFLAILNFHSSNDTLNFNSWTRWN